MNEHSEANFFRVLCVDDSAQMQTALKLGLGLYGFEVITASHGIDALMQFKARSGEFGAIITDNDMPQMNGLEFVRSVRATGYKGRIIVMSGHLQVERLREYQPLFISGFFHKPFEVGMLATMLLQGEQIEKRGERATRSG